MFSFNLQFYQSHAYHADKDAIRYLFTMSNYMFILDNLHTKCVLSLAKANITKH